MPVLASIRSGAAYLWDRAKRLFRSASDRQPVEPRTVRYALDNVLDAGANRLRGLSGQLAKGDLSTAGWVEGVRSELTSLHLAARLAAVGGIEQLTPEHTEAVSTTLAGQFGYLDRFAGQVDAGDVDPTSDGFAERAASYADAARTLSYEAPRREAEEANGSRWERRQLNPDAEHCDSCRAAADDGWVPFGTGPAIGTLQCGQKCRCQVEYSTAETMPDDADFDAGPVVRTDAVDFSGDPGGEGRWVTINGSHVYIKEGKVVTGAGSYRGKDFGRWTKSEFDATIRHRTGPKAGQTETTRDFLRRVNGYRSERPDHPHFQGEHRREVERKVRDLLRVKAESLHDPRLLATIIPGPIGTGALYYVHGQEAVTVHDNNATRPRSAVIRPDTPPDEAEYKLRKVLKLKVPPHLKERFGSKTQGSGREDFGSSDPVARTGAVEFDAADEPRDERGRWTTGGSGGGKSVPAPKGHAAALARAFDSNLARTGGLSAEQKASYGAAAHAVLAAMPETATKRVAANLKVVSWHPDTGHLGDALAKDSPKVRRFLDGGGKVGGAYKCSTKTLYLDGPNPMPTMPSELGGKTDSMRHVYAHEFSHAVDGSDSALSKHPDWQAAWHAEVNTTPARLSTYARQDPSEGFAEFGRLVYASGVDRRVIEHYFPACSAYWKRAGIWS